MADLVPTSEIETVVGTKRRQTLHCGRCDFESETFYILHSRECLESGIDLRECVYSLAMDRGIDPDDWPDGPVILGIVDGFLALSEATS